MADTFAKASISTEAARRLIAAAEAKAAELGKPFVTAIVDDEGVLKAFSRMDGAPLLSVQVAQDKAYTAVGFGLPDAWLARLHQGRPAAGRRRAVGHRPARGLRRRLPDRSSATSSWAGSASAAATTART